MTVTQATALVIAIRELLGLLRDWQTHLPAMTPEEKALYLAEVRADILPEIKALEDEYDKLITLLEADLGLA